MKKILSLVVVATVRDATLQGIRIFIPMLVVLKGGTIAEGGMLLFAITLSCTFAGILGGKLADTRGDEKVMLWTLGLSPIFLISGLQLFPGVILRRFEYGYRQDFQFSGLHSPPP